MTALARGDSVLYTMLDVDGSLVAAKRKMAEAGVTTVTSDRWLAGEAR